MVLPSACVCTLDLTPSSWVFLTTPGVVVLILRALPGPVRMSPIPKLAQELWATPASFGFGWLLTARKFWAKGRKRKIGNIMLIWSELLFCAGHCSERIYHVLYLNPEHLYSVDSLQMRKQRQREAEVTFPRTHSVTGRTREFRQAAQLKGSPPCPKRRGFLRFPAPKRTGGQGSFCVKRPAPH